MPLSVVVKTRIRLGLLLTLALFDFSTDVIAVDLYWRVRERTGLGVAIAASVSLGLGLLIFIGYVLTIVGCFKDGEISNQDEFVLRVFRNVESVFESIPQLWINLFVLSKCNIEHNIILYVAAGFSFVTLLHAVILLDRSVHSQEREDEEEEHNSPRYIFTHMDFILLYSSKGLALAARILILVYLSYFVHWWTAMFVLFHWVFMSLLITMYIVRVRGASLTLEEISKDLLTGFIYGAFYVFTWFVGDNLGYELFFMSVFMIENSIGLMASYEPKVEGYCLYDQVVWVHVGLNMVAFTVLSIYILIRTYLVS